MRVPVQNTSFDEMRKEEAMAHRQTSRIQHLGGGGGEGAGAGAGVCESITAPQAADSGASNGNRDCGGTNRFARGRSR